mgnify:CR=1 FL=1
MCANTADAADRTEPLDVLHVASFTGNVGDNANHNGTYGQLQENLGRDLRCELLEMRKFYQNYTKPDALAFDDSFVEQANEADLVLIGGGSFFDLWIEDSATGTTVDITPSRLDRIETPLVFYGLGCIPVDPTETVVRKFRQFLDHAFAAENVMVSVRNDGSREHVRTTVGEEWAEGIEEIPDGGFFVRVDDAPHPELPPDDTVAAINVVADMRERRFGDEAGYEEFVAELAAFADEFLARDDERHLLFVPHIYSDLRAISAVLSKMDVMFRRERVTTAPYLNGPGSERYIFDLYDQADLSMGLRFHANVCSIGLETPSIGLANGHPKVGDLYRSIDCADRLVDVSSGTFRSELLDVAEDSIDKAPSISGRYREVRTELSADLRDAHRRIERLLEA